MVKIDCCNISSTETLNNNILNKSRFVEITTVGMSQNGTAVKEAIKQPLDNRQRGIVERVFIL